MKFASSLELLENRIAPAGLVQVTVVNGSLKLAGDSVANDLTVAATQAGQLTITGNNDTMIAFNGVTAAAATVSVPVNDFASNLGMGDDVLTLTNLALSKNLVLKDLSGANTFTVSGVRVGGNFTATGGDGADSFTFNNKLFAAKAVVFALGQGDNSVILAVDAFTNASFRYDGGAGVDTIAKAAGDWDVAGTLTFNMGGGANNINLSGGSLIVGGATNITHGTHDGGVSSTNLTEFSAVFKSGVTISYLDGSNSTTINAFDFALRSSLRINGGTGADNVAFGSTITAQSITLRLGDGPDLFSHSGANITVSGLADYGFGEGLNTISGTFTVANYNGGLKVTGGSGDDLLSVGASVFHLPKGATIDGGTGTNNVGLRGNLLDAAGTVLLKNGSHTVGTSQASLVFNRLSALNVMATFGEGAKGFTINGTSDTFIKGAVTISAPGAGGLSLGMNGAVLDVLGKLTITGGSGGMSAALTPTFINLGAVQVTGGSGTDNFSVSSSGQIKSMTLALGAGSSSVSLSGALSGGATRNPLTITGALSIATPSLLAADSDQVQLRDMTVVGKTTVTQGAGAGAIGLQNLIAAALTVDAKAGNDVINLETEDSGIISVFTGAVSLTLGAGANTLTIGNNTAAAKADFRSTVKIIGGPDADTLNDNGNLYVTGQPVKTGI